MDEVSELLGSRGVEGMKATILAVLTRKPSRAKVLKVWLNSHPTETDEEISRQAHKTAQTVEPTRSGIPQKFCGKRQRLQSKAIS